MSSVMSKQIEQKEDEDLIGKTSSRLENELLLKEFDLMKALSLKGIKRMMETGTLTVENLEMLSLELSAFHGLTRVMKILLTTGGADVNRVNPETGDTALHWAVRSEQVEMISLLKQYGAKSKINKMSETPEKIALIIENESVLKCLAQVGTK